MNLSAAAWAVTSDTFLHQPLMADLLKGEPGWGGQGGACHPLSAPRPQRAGNRSLEQISEARGFSASRREARPGFATEHTPRTGWEAPIELRGPGREHAGRKEVRGSGTFLPLEPKVSERAGERQEFHSLIRVSLSQHFPQDGPLSVHPK